MTVALSCHFYTFHTITSYSKLQQLTPQLSEFQKKENKLLNFQNIFSFLFIILVICHINYCMDRQPGMISNKKQLFYNNRQYEK